MKTSAAKNVEIDDEQTSSSQIEDKLSQLLAQVSQKLTETSTLESKFDRIIFKVEKIEESQNKILDQISDIHETMYNPDKGIFSRIKEVEQKDSKNVLILEQSISDIGNLQEEEKKKVENFELILHDHKENIKNIEQKISDFEKIRSHLSSSIKWMIITLLSGAGGLFSKVIYDRLSKLF